MKIVFLFCTLLSISFCSWAQTPQDGRYQSSDGYYSFSLTVLDDGSLEVVEPNKTSIYTKSGNQFQHSEAKYSHYMIKVTSATELYTFKDGYEGQTKFTWIGSDVLSEEDCVLAEKYQELAADEDDPEVQAYTFCAVAALAKCNYTAEGFATYAASIVLVMKQIIVDKNKCPCTDVIPQSIWDAN